MKLPLVANPEQISPEIRKSLKIVDVRPQEAYSEAHIPGAVHLDAVLLGRSENLANGLLPDPAGIETLATAIGLQENDHVLAYDNGAGNAAARFIWVMHAYGFMNISWLNGGFNGWIASGGDSNANPVDIESNTSSLQFVAGNVISVDALNAKLDEPDMTVLDVRSAAEFEGSDVRSARGGHVPGALHSEWTVVFDEAGFLKDDATLHELFAELGVVKEKQVVVYCQTHQRSALTYIVLKHLGYENVCAIDGAWSAWGNDENVPIETGAP